MDKFDEYLKNKSKSEKQNWKVKMKGKKMGEERKVRL